MRTLSALPLVLVLPLLLLAQDTKKPDARPNTLTDKEVKDGWIQLFDGETTLGWKIDGPAKVEDGILVLGGDKPVKAATTTAFTDYTLSVEPTWEGEKPPLMRIGLFRGAYRGAGKGFGFINTSVRGLDSPSHPISIEAPAGTRVRLRNVKLRPPSGERLFNGKDLTGWKVFKGTPRQSKSKYTVTKEGWLNVKDGPGDLQTEKVFADFVLQLECISNGKHLNSGIFFRALPGEYWQGYECQIRNQFTDKPTQKYTVEEHDPTTHKLLGKKTLMSPAVDYGTGAIYRRMPARKQLAKDNEWFTLTIAARGRHLATWVNGVQQVDWTDNRPADKNPRKGYRGEAGAISIQGHDKTTDLSFRNLRIAELPRTKSK